MLVVEHFEVFSKTGEIKYICKVNTKLKAWRGGGTPVQLRKWNNIKCDDCRYLTGGMKNLPTEAKTHW